MATRRTSCFPPLAALLTLATGSVDAQTLGSAFTYQGRLTDAGSPANGLYDLQLCVYDVLSGASPLQCAPALEDVPVEGGLFTVAVDFGSGAFVGQQRFLELRVRPGASTAGFTTLSPRQLLRATPEALRANVASAAPWAGLAGVPPGFADGIDHDSGGTVTSVSAGAGLSGGPITSTGALSIATGGITAAMIGAGQVGATQLAASAVDSARIADETVAAIDIGPNAVGASELANNAVDTAAIGDAQVTTAKIAPGAVGAAQVDSAQVQLRISGSCGEGEYFRGINADGSLQCGLLPVPVSRVLDQSGDVGSHLALAIRADQRPLVAYHDETLGNLKLYDCADAACSSGTRRTLDSPGDVGENVAIAIGTGGLAGIAYRDVTNQTLKFYACANAACSSGTARTLDAGVNVGPAVAIALRADGRPLIAYDDRTALRARIYDCDNAGCTSGTARPVSNNNPAYGVALAIRSDDRALIAIGGNGGAAAAVRVFDCANIACTSGTLRTLGATTYAKEVAVAIRTNGRPLIASAGVGSSLNLHDCADAACSNATAGVYPVNPDDTVGMVLRADGRALVAFGALAAPKGLRVIDCVNAGCSTGSNRALVTGGDVGSRLAFALRGDGRPVIAHYDADNADLRLYVCGSSDCL